MERRCQLCWRGRFLVGSGRAGGVGRLQGGARARVTMPTRWHRLARGLRRREGVHLGALDPPEATPNLAAVGPERSQPPPSRDTCPSFPATCSPDAGGRGRRAPRGTTRPDPTLSPQLFSLMGMSRLASRIPCTVVVDRTQQVQSTRFFPSRVPLLKKPEGHVSADATAG